VQVEKPKLSSRIVTLTHALRDRRDALATMADFQISNLMCLEHTFVTQIHSFICISPSTPLEALEFYMRLKLCALMIS
jgi:hypothetical protein